MASREQLSRIMELRCSFALTLALIPVVIALSSAPSKPLLSSSAHRYVDLRRSKEIRRCGSDWQKALALLPPIAPTPPIVAVPTVPAGAADVAAVAAAPSYVDCSRSFAARGQKRAAALANDVQS